MKLFILVLIIGMSTPWYWQFTLPQNIFKIEIREDIQKARQNVEWLRSKAVNNKFKVLFINWPTLFMQERLGVMFESLDIGNYFFAGHPRERVGVHEGQKFFFFQFIILLFGIFSKEIKTYFKILIITFFINLILIFLFKWRDFNQTILTSLPLIFTMVLGLKLLILKHRKLLIPLGLLVFIEISFFVLSKFRL